MLPTDTRRIQKILSSGDYVLVLGAGVSVEAGLPTWEKALKQLADLIPKSAQHMAVAMGHEIEGGRFLEAAELFFLADITNEDRARILSNYPPAKPGAL